MGLNKCFGIGLAISFLLLIPAVTALAVTEVDCGPGYTWDRMSGVGCKQTNCNDIANAHYSYVGDCICGSSGSMYEDPADPNTECYYPFDHASCPGCLYACVGTLEPCPDEEQDNYTEDDQASTNTNSNQNTNTNINQNTNANINSNQNINISQAGTNISLSTSGNITELTCENECRKYLWGRKNAELISYSGTSPNCKCQIDIKDNLNRLTSTISSVGSDETTYTYDKNGNLIKKVKINRKDEVEKVRIRIGNKYTQEEIDKLLDPAKIDAWFQDQVKDIKTETSGWNAQFWWQHMVAIWDHGRSGNSAEFVDTYQFGRCGDSMLWLERDLLNKLEIGKDLDNPGHKHEGILSITGEKYGNMLNHTSLMIRPKGVSNIEWDGMVKELKKLSGGEESNPGIKAGDLKNVDPRLLDAKVLDPYKKEVTTVREFIKGWSYIRIG